MNSIFSQLLAKCRPLIESYEIDLLEYDKAAIGGDTAPAVPFLHWTRATGTHLVHLQPAEAYPPANVWIPYLFASAERRHILDQIVVQARCFGNDRVRIVHYFDGRQLREITVEQAIAIAEDYRRRTGDRWNAKDYRSTWDVPAGCTLRLGYGGKRELAPVTPEREAV